MPKKIAMIGAGSVVFCKTLIADMLATPVLQDSEGDISEILCEGAAIGLYPELNLTEKVFIFEKRNRFHFPCTDGFTFLSTWNI